MNEKSVDSLLDALKESAKLKRKYFNCFANSDQSLLNKLIEEDKKAHPNKKAQERNKEILSYFVDFIQGEGFKKEKINDYYCFLNENFSGHFLGLYTMFLWVSQPNKTVLEFMEQNPVPNFTVQLFEAANDLFRLYENFDPVSNPEENLKTPFSWLSKREKIKFVREQAENFCSLGKYFFTKKEVGMKNKKEVKSLKHKI